MQYHQGPFDGIHFNVKIQKKTKPCYHGGGKGRQCQFLHGAGECQHCIYGFLPMMSCFVGGVLFNTDTVLGANRHQVDKNNKMDCEMQFCTCSKNRLCMTKEEKCTDGNV